MRQKSRNAQCAAMQAQNTSSRAQVAVAPSPQQDPAGFLRHLYEVAVRNALPIEGLARHLPKPPKGRTLVLGAGKAGGSMAQALEALWPQDAPLSGLVVTRYAHIPPRPEGLPVRCAPILRTSSVFPPARLSGTRSASSIT